MRGEPSAIGEVIKRLLAGWGVDHPEAWVRVRDEWADLVGEPWATQARPMTLRRGVLVVEAITPAAVGILRYGVGGLQLRLEKALGRGLISEIEVRPPPRRGIGGVGRLR